MKRGLVTQHSISIYVDNWIWHRNLTIADNKTFDLMLCDWPNQIAKH